MIAITLYTTAGCHLCELAENLLNELSMHYDIIIKPTEIGDDDGLIERYGIKIPVAKFHDNSELNWPFTQHDLKQKLEHLQSD